MRIPVLSLLLCLLVTGHAIAAETTPRNFVQVYDPYIEIHTGAGRGYPIFHVISRDEWVEILMRRTDWFLLRTESGIEGWASRAQMQQTLNPDGEKVEIREFDQSDFISREWEMGLQGGNFEGAAVITLYGGYHFTDNISAEASLSQVLGSFSTSILFGIHLIHEPFPEWTISPFFTLGTGIIQTTPKSSLALVSDRSDQYANYGLGVRMHLTKRFLIRIDYKNYVIFSSRNDNEEIEEWKAGFAFFF